MAKKTKTKLAFEIKRKKRPRGKPFAKGNKVGHRFPKGQSPNPGGRPAFKEVSKAARAVLGSPIPGDKTGQTFAERIVEVLAFQAIAGDRAAAAELADRAEGRPAQSLQLSNEDDPLQGILDELRARHTEILATKTGPAEDDDEGDVQ